MSVKTSFYSSLIALSGTVSTTANTTAKVINNVASSVDMLDRYVERAKLKQSLRYKAEDDALVFQIADEVAEAQSMREYELENRIKGNTQLSARFVQNRNRILSVLMPAPAPASQTQP